LLALLYLPSYSPNFHSPEGIIYTRMRNLPASRIRAAHLEQCLLSDGCTLGVGTRVERCVLGVRTHLGQHVTLRDTVVNGANVRIINQRHLQQAEGENYVIRDGIVIIPNEAVVPDGTII
jgi:glucose-1-phosphate adenylyltransferase